MTKLLEAYTEMMTSYVCSVITEFGKNMAKPLDLHVTVKNVKVRRTNTWTEGSVTTSSMKLFINNIPVEWNVWDKGSILSPDNREIIMEVVESELSLQELYKDKDFIEYSMGDQKLDDSKQLQEVEGWVKDSLMALNALRNHVYYLIALYEMLDLSYYNGKNSKTVQEDNTEVKSRTYSNNGVGDGAPYIHNFTD